MALDLTVLDEHESPVSSVALPLDAHSRMIDAAEGAKLPLVMRMHDYWGDAEFEITELKALREELEWLLLEESDDKELGSLLRASIGLVDFAAKNRTSVHALAD